MPLPNSKDNHQFENALFYKEKECCWMLNQKTFEDNIEQLLNNILSNNSEFSQKKENEMNEKEGLDKNPDSVADSISAVLIILIPVVAIIYWLSGLPTS